jgi:hypothetical protein
MTIKEVHLEICYVQATPEEMLKRERAFDLLAQVIADLFLKKLAEENAAKENAAEPEQLGAA